VNGRYAKTFAAPGVTKRGGMPVNVWAYGLEPAIRASAAWAS